MSMQTIDEGRVMNIYSWFDEAMSRAGIRNANNGADASKTYKFRLIQKFADMAYNDWRLDDESIRDFIYTAIKHAKTKGLLHKGAGLLTINSIIVPTLDTLCNRSKAHKSEINTIKKSHDFIIELSNNGDLVTLLRRPIRYGGLPSIIYYYTTGRISSAYLAVSKVCRLAMRSLAAEDTADLPSLLDLKLIRMRLVGNVDTRAELSKILGNDLISGN